ncbi:MAG: hypothetical protein ACI4N8_05190 [Megasphaera sp.]|uniref:hypothetical protein n=1 Tax=Megasphaera sp. TaxID=2023260 RepID=UPI003EFFAD8D
MLKRCKFEPSIAEVMEEWYAIVRENCRPQAFQAGPAQTVPQRHINRLKDTRGRPLTSQTAFGGQLPYKGSLVRPAARFHHSPFWYNDGFL